MSHWRKLVVAPVVVALTGGALSLTGCEEPLEEEPLTPMEQWEEPVTPEDPAAQEQDPLPGLPPEPQDEQPDDQEPDDY